MPELTEEQIMAMPMGQRMRYLTAQANKRTREKRALDPTTAADVAEPALGATPLVSESVVEQPPLGGVPGAGYDEFSLQKGVEAVTGKTHQQELDEIMASGG